MLVCSEGDRTLHARFIMPWAIGAALGLSGWACSSDDGSSQKAGGSSMQAAGSAGQPSTGGGGTTSGSGGQPGAGGSATFDASPDVAAPAGDADLGMREASSSERSTDANAPFGLTSTTFKERADGPVVYR